jgi:surface polysaccharide O-acyltransferase-like enzyme
MHWYLYVLFILKISIIFLFIKNKVDPSPETQKRLSYMDKLFTILLTILMIYIFHPYTKNPTMVDKETKLFLFTFAILTLSHSF